MKVSHLIEGLLILSRYYDEDDCHLGSYRHELYMCITDKPLSTSDANRLFDLGWYQVDPNTDMEVEGRDYNRNYGWGLHV